MTDKKVIGVRFSKVGKIYHFDATNHEDVVLGCSVVVETSRGKQLGEVVQIVENTNVGQDGSIKPIERRATPRDLLLRQTCQQNECEVLIACRKRAAELGIKGVKFITAEFSLDGNQLTVLYGTESEEKVDLKTMRGDVQRLFSLAHVEMRMIGPRDVAKFLGGMGACGLEMRCCSKFLTDFSSISIKMAKEQGISLTPTEITGMCGRLRCCLIYEYQNYVEARQQLPKRNKYVKTPQGEGKVIDVYPLRGAVLVELPEIGNREFLRDDIIVLDEPSNIPNRPPTSQPPTRGVGQDDPARARPKKGKRHNDRDRSRR